MYFTKLSENKHNIQANAPISFLVCSRPPPPHFLSSFFSLLQSELIAAGTHLWQWGGGGGGGVEGTGDRSGEMTKGSLRVLTD